MRNLAKVLTILLLFFVFATPSIAEIKSVKIRSNDRGQIFFDYFKFTNTGHLSIAVSSLSVTSLPVTSNISRPDLSRFGFFLLSEQLEYRFFREQRWSNISCALDSQFTSLLFTFQDLSYPHQSSFNKSYTMTYPNAYSLYFANCNPLSHVTMDILTKFYNMHNDTTKDYLSAGITKLPGLYYTFSIIYGCFLWFWIIVCCLNHKSFHMVHFLMVVLLDLKEMSLICAGEVQESVKVTRTRSYEWDILFYICQFLTPDFLYTSGFGYSMVLDHRKLFEPYIFLLSYFGK